MIAIFTLIVFIIDIVSKLFITNHIALGESIKIIDKFMYLTYVRNTGAAWSMFDNNRYFVLILSALIIIGFIVYILKNTPKNKLEKIAYAFILGGALGNFLNRFIYGYVVDFIDIKIFGYDYPIFNLADLFIVIGVIIFGLHSWRSNDGNKSNRK